MSGKFIAIPLSSILIKNSNYASSNLRKRIFKENLFINKCVLCGQDPFWNSQLLTLQLDHINGINNDHRLVNLRLLCPNCHSQTETYGGKNKTKIKKEKSFIEYVVNDYKPKISFRQKKNIIWNIDLVILKTITKSSKSFAEILNYFKLPLKGAQYKALKERLFWENIAFNHISLGAGHNKGKLCPRESISLDLVLIKESKYSSYLIKKRLLRENLLYNICTICNLEPLWNNKALTLQLDHINGSSNDNRLENLRILCPNCHSQTTTYAGKNNK